VHRARAPVPHSWRRQWREGKWGLKEGREAWNGGSDDTLRAPAIPESATAVIRHNLGLHHLKLA